VRSWLRSPDAGLLGGILVAGFNLQLAIIAVGPLIDTIRSDTGMSAALAGLLQTIPFLCIGCVAFGGPQLVVSFGAERLVGYALGVMCAATALRSAMPSAALLLAASIPIGLASGALSLGLPAAVKTHFPGRGGAVIGGYTAALSLGAAIAALTAVPLSHALGTWRLALAADAIPAAIALPIWLKVARPYYTHGSRAGARAGASLFRPPPYGLLLAALFACQSVVFTACITWVAPLYRQHGWSGGRAGLATATISLITIPAALLVPARSDGRDRRPWLIASGLLLTIGTLGLAVAPTSAPWFWLLVFGVGTGAIFPLCIAMPLDLVPGQADVARLTAWMLGAGYIASAASPTIVGALHDATGTFTLPLLLLAGIGVLATVLASSNRLKARGLYAEPVG
jgi:CP family cyanate transporter-like MFS transporter